MVNLRVFTLIALLLPLISCTDITEHEIAFKAGLHIISSEDFSTIKTITDMVGARCLLVYPGNVFVASTEGTILRYDSESMELLEEYLVAAPSPVGFSDMVFSSLENTAYLIGSLGMILEINLPDCTVLDEFNVCQSPVKLALGPGSEYLFVADGPLNKIYQVAIVNNKPHDSVSIYYTIKCMEPFQNPDSLLVGTSDGPCLIEVLSSSTIRYVIYGLDIPFMALSAVPNDSIFVGVTNYSVGIFSPTVLLEENFYGGVSIEGNIDFIAMGHDWQHAYVLSYLGDNTSRLVSYNYRFHTISQEVEIPGYPLDLEVSGNGVIYALTTE